jgi:hypothetical protein
VSLDARVDRLLTRVDFVDAPDRPLRGYRKGEQNDDGVGERGRTRERNRCCKATARARFISSHSQQ